MVEVLEPASTRANSHLPSLRGPWLDCIENTAYNSSFIVVWHVKRGCCLAMAHVFVDAGMCLAAFA
jgi:hypothetical protein